MVDLRWGIQDQSRIDHTTFDICMQEIDNCRQHSVGPSFVVSTHHGCQANGASYSDSWKCLGVETVYVSSGWLSNLITFFSNYAIFIDQLFLGQKYGYRPIPAAIKDSEFEAIRSALEHVHNDSVTLLDTWYKKDTNRIPAYYQLQPISSVLRNIENQVCYALHSVHSI